MRATVASQYASRQGPDLITSFACILCSHIILWLSLPPRLLDAYVQGLRACLIIADISVLSLLTMARRCMHRRS